REDVEAALLALGDHQPSRKFLAVLGRQEQPSLLVQARRMSAKEHQHSPPAPGSARPRPPVRPLLPTAHHRTPHFPTVNEKSSPRPPLAHEKASSGRWSGVGDRRPAAPRR